MKNLSEYFRVLLIVLLGLSVALPIHAEQTGAPETSKPPEFSEKKVVVDNTISIWKEQKQSRKLLWEEKYDEAIALLTPHLELGFDESAFYLANVYTRRVEAGELLDPKTREPYIEKAIELYKRPTNLRFSRGQREIGDIYRDSVGVPQSFKKAVEFYTEAVKRNEHGARNALARMYEHGFGVEKDTARALELYRQDLDDYERGSRMAIARFYEFGVVVEKDLHAALELYTLTEQQSDIFRLNKKIQNPEFYSKPLEIDRKTKAQMASVGPDGWRRIFSDCLEGLSDSEKTDQDGETKQALNGLFTLASGGHQLSKDKLADLYLEGRYFDENYTAAAHWYGDAAENGSKWGADRAAAIHSDVFKGAFDPKLAEHYREISKKIESDNTE